MLSVTVLGLYFWAFFADDLHDLGPALLINDWTALLAGVTFLLSVMFYFWLPEKFKTGSTYIIYLLLAATTVGLILSSGEINSPFITVWMLVAVFSAIYGWLGVTPLLLAVIYYALQGYLDQSLSNADMLSIGLAGLLPLLVSYIIWHVKPASRTDGDKAYRKLANELSETSNKSDIVINAISDGVIAIDSQGVIELINPAAQQIVGWDQGEALKLNYKSVLKLIGKDSKELQPSVDPVSTVLADNKQVRNDDLTLVTMSGKKLIVSLIVTPIGQIGSGALIVFRDVTNQRKEEREQAEFISTASHEMRTPVASMEGYLGLALNPATAQIDDKARDFIEKAHESAKHLGALFQDLLDISKAEDGRLDSKPKVIDLAAFTSEVVTSLKPLADKKNLSIISDADSNNGEDEPGERRLTPIFYVHIDSDHLRELLSNLIENAIKYTPQGSVKIDIDGDEDHATVSIADSGIGIPTEDIPHLFQKFYRVDNTDTREIGGTGLGLYLCRKLAESMSGRIWAESEYKRGSIFHVELPRISHEDAIRMLDESTEEKPEVQFEAKGVSLEDQTLAATAPEAAVASQPAPAPTPAEYQSEPAQAQPQPQLTSPQPGAQPAAPQPPAAAQQPTTQMATPPQYITPAAAPPASPEPQPQAGGPVAPQIQPDRQNTPLSVIEMNPSQYMQANQNQQYPSPESQTNQDTLQ
ncbi:MAG: ATP-binding protein [bacterium]|nr:ATP-binding protein [bacterium]